MNILRRLALAVALLIAAILPLRADPQAVQMLNAMRAQHVVPHAHTHRGRTGLYAVSYTHLTLPTIE